MKTTNDSENANRILAGLGEVLDIVEGGAKTVHVPEDVDVKAIRVKLGLTQGEFALRFGFTAAAVKDWEQRRRKPEAAARVLLKVIDHEPGAVERALAYAYRDGVDQ